MRVTYCGVRASQAKRMYESERESIEASYWDAKDQVRQRLLGAVEERRRKLREEKEGGDVVSGTSKALSHLASKNLSTPQIDPLS